MLNDSASALRKLQESPEFLPNTISRILNETEAPSNEDASKFAQTFLPVVDGNYNELAVVVHNPTGMAEPFDTALAQTNLPSVDYRRFSGNISFGGKVVYGKKSLERLMRKDNLNEKQTIAQMQAEALATLKQQFDNRIAWLAGKLCGTNALTLDGNGIHISESSIFGYKSPFHLDLDDTEATGFTDVRDLPGRFAFTMPDTLYWWNEGNATPNLNLQQLIIYATEMKRLKIKRMWLSTEISMHLENDTTFQQLLDWHGTDRLTKGFVFQEGTYKGIEIMPASPQISIETNTVLDYTLGAGTGTLDVVSIQGIEAGDALTLEVRDVNTNRMYDFHAVVSSVAIAGGIPRITLTGEIKGTQLPSGSTKIEAGTRVTVTKDVIPRGHIIFETEGTENYQVLASLPSALNSPTNPSRGYFANTYANPDPEFPELKIIAGLESNLEIVEFGRFFTMKVLDV